MQRCSCFSDDIRRRNDLFRRGDVYMKNKKGQMELGPIIAVFMAIIVGVSLFLVIAQEVGDSTSTVPLVNESLSADAAASTTQYLAYRSISSVVIYNETSEGIGVIPAANYTVTTNVINPTNGELSIGITPSADITEAIGSLWQVSGTVQPQDYIGDSGARAMASIIVIFFALAIGVVALTPTLQSKLLDAIGK